MLLYLKRVDLMKSQTRYLYLASRYDRKYNSQPVYYYIDDDVGVTKEGMTLEAAPT